MMTLQSILITLLTIVGNSFLYAQVVVGDKAPQLTIQEWLKGGPVSSFNDGINVIEFSGTWCPPCRKAIPHLSELTNTYRGKVNFVSVYVKENDRSDTTDLRYVDNVRYFINAMESKINFAVAVDVPHQTTMQTWKPRGVPFAFIIDSGFIIWNGHPLDLAPVLRQITAGNFDAQAAIRDQKAFDDRINEITYHTDDENSQRALNAIDSLINFNPQKKWLYIIKFEILTKQPGGEAYQFLKWMLDSKVQNFDWPHFVGGAFRLIPEASRNYEMELKAIERTIEESETEYLKAYPLSLKAATFAAMKDYKKAYDWCLKAIESSKAPGGTTMATLEYERELILYQYAVLSNHNLKKAGGWLKHKLDSMQTHKLRIDYSNKLINILLKNPKSDYKLALEIIERLSVGDPANRAFYLDKKSSVYAAMGEFEKAIDCCRMVIEIYDKQGISSKVHEFKNRIANYRAQQKFSYKP